MHDISSAPPCVQIIGIDGYRVDTNADGENALRDFVKGHVRKLREVLRHGQPGSVRLNVVIEQAAGWTAAAQISAGIEEVCGTVGMMREDRAYGCWRDLGQTLRILGEEENRGPREQRRLQRGRTTTAATKAAGVHNARIFTTTRHAVIAADVVTSRMATSSAARKRFCEQLGAFTEEAVLDREGRVSRYLYSGKKSGDGDDLVLAWLIATCHTMHLWPAELRADLERAVTRFEAARMERGFY